MIKIKTVEELEPLRSKRYIEVRDKFYENINKVLEKDVLAECIIIRPWITCETYDMIDVPRAIVDQAALDLRNAGWYTKVDSCGSIMASRLPFKEAKRRWYLPYS